jgi:hypothetical protein
MRVSLVLLIGVLAVVFGFAASAARTAGGLPMPTGNTYPLHLKFDLKYEIDWSLEEGMEGRQADPCASWSRETGSTTVLVQDAPWKRRGERRRTRHGMPGSLTFYPEGQAPKWATGGWAGGSVVGRAKGTVRRSWSQSGGPTEAQVAGPCKNSSPWKPITADCGNRSVTTSTATVIPERRKNAPSLKDLMTALVTPVKNTRDVLSFTVNFRDPFRSCPVKIGPAFPVNLGAPVFSVLGLRFLPPGDTSKSGFRSAGKCAYDLPDNTQCTFNLEIDWEIRRWKPGERYP